jgi:GNAT superfamily N-acetyltransferase
MTDTINMNDFIINDNKEQLDIDVIYNYLSIESYWAEGIGLEMVKTSIDNSLCFGVYYKNNQIGFCRVITDYATFGYLGDVFVLTEFRGKGISKKLIDYVINHNKLQGLRRFLLATSDAHTLYEKFGFASLSKPHTFMERNNTNIYKSSKKS